MVYKVMVDWIKVSMVCVSKRHSLLDMCQNIDPPRYLRDIAIAVSQYALANHFERHSILGDIPY